MDDDPHDAARHGVLELADSRTEADARDFRLLYEQAVVGLRPGLDDVIGQAGDIATLCYQFGRIGTICPILPDSCARAIPQCLKGGIEDAGLQRIPGILDKVRFVTPRLWGRGAASFLCCSHGFPSHETGVHLHLRF